MHVVKKRKKLNAIHSTPESTEKSKLCEWEKRHSLVGKDEVDKERQRSRGVTEEVVRRSWKNDLKIVWSVRASEFQYLSNEKWNVW